MSLSSVATRTMYAASTSDFGALAGGSASPMIDGVRGGTGDFVSLLSSAQSKGIKLALKVVGGSAQYRDPATSEFSLAMWKAKMDEAFAKTSPQQMGNFFQSGAILFNWLIDDMKTGSTVFPGGTPTFDDIEEMARYSKSEWTMIPTVARAENQYWKNLCIQQGASNYTWLDAGWAMWHKKWGNAMTWFQNHVNDGRSVGLGAVVGYNLLNGGSGLTAPWNVHPDISAQFGMSPQEMDAVSDAFSALTYCIGFNVWSADPADDNIDYWHWPSIQTAMQYTVSKCIDRIQGPINWRDQSPSGSTDTTSGSSQTVAGSWNFLGVNVTKANSPSLMPVTIPASAASGSLIGIVAYSRDSNWTAGAPSGYSEQQRVSGTSAQGGDLVLFTKIADASDAGQITTVKYTGAANGAATQVIAFAFSGNTSRVGGLVPKVGSARTWPHGSANMGPVPGLTSTVSDSLVMVIAAKTNNFENGDPVPDGTMSATTSGGETWNRMLLSDNVSGPDSGVLIDYAATSGTPSITTKSWTQSQGTLSDASGSGSGFMVAFAPAAIVAGQPPAITALEDITWSIASTLSFTLQSTGSTPITWSVSSGPSNVTLGASTGAFQWDPLSVNTYVIVIKASNSFGSDTEDFRVVVVASGAEAGGGTGAGNTAPVIVHPGDKTVTAHDLLSFIVTATDADNDPIRYALENNPDGSFMDDVTGQFVWIPRGEQGPGTYPIIVVASDGQAESRSTFTVTVTDTPWTRAGGPASQRNKTNLAGNTFTPVTLSSSAFSRI